MTASPGPALQNAASRPRRSKMPDTLLILVCLALIAWGATWIVPEGRFVPGPEGGLSLERFETAGVHVVTRIKGDVNKTCVARAPRVARRRFVVV